MGTAMSAGAVVLISVGLFFFAQMLTPLFVSSQDAASLAVLVGTYSRMMAPFFFLLCHCRSSFRCLLRHGRYDTAYDYHAAGYLPAACDWYLAGTSGIWNHGMYCCDLYCFMDCGRSFFPAALAL